MFNEITQECIENLNVIDKLFYSVALEADENVNTDADKTQRSNQFADKFKEIIERIMAMVERVILAVKTAFERVLLTDKGFKKEIREAEVNRRPLNGVTLITYPYVSEILNSIMGKFKKTVTEVVSSIKASASDSPDSPILMGKDEFNKYIFTQVGAPDNIDNMDIYFKYVREKFRGKKSEQTIMKDSIPRHLKLIESYTDIQSSINSDLGFLGSKINEIKTTLSIQGKSNSVSDEDKKKLMVKIRNLAYIYNMYSSFCRIYMELKIEQMLNSRTIVRRLYQL